MGADRERESAPRAEGQTQEEWRTSAGPDIVDVADWRVPPPGAVRGRMTAPSGLLATLSAGPADGESVVLVPGVTGSKEDFSLMMPLLAAAGFRVLSYDLAGQYESADAGPENLVPPRKGYDYGLFVDDLVCVLQSRAVPSHVLGYSFAGIVTQLALAHRPDLFASLTLMSCPPHPGRSLRGVRFLGPLSAHAGRRFGAALMLWGLRHNVNHVPPSRFDFVRHRLTMTRKDSVRDVFGLMAHAPDVRAVIASAPVPKLVAVGEHDLWPLEVHRRFAAAIDARLSIYPGGHSPCETSPIELSHDLVRLIRDC